MKKKYIVLILILIIAIVTYNYIYQDHRNIEGEKAAFTLNAKELLDGFLENSEVSNTKYLDKTIEVSGVVTEVDNLSLVLDGQVFCTFTEKPVIGLNEEVTVKGRLIGFDDLLE
jgi:hypothetical protein